MDGFTYGYLSFSNFMEIRYVGMDTLASMTLHDRYMGSIEAYYRSL